MQLGIRKVQMRTVALRNEAEGTGVWIIRCTPVEQIDQRDKPGFESGAGQERLPQRMRHRREAVHDDTRLEEIARITKLEIRIVPSMRGRGHLTALSRQE
jgi:hypothetical protein